MRKTIQVPKYINDILKSKEHITGEGMSPLYIPAILDPLETCLLCIVVDCKF